MRLEATIHYGKITQSLFVQRRGPAEILSDIKRIGTDVERLHMPRTMHHSEEGDIYHRGNESVGSLALVVKPTIISSMRPSYQI
jgi:hypothetical protein